MSTTPRRPPVGTAARRVGAACTLAVGIVLSTAACSGPNPFETAATATTAVDTDATDTTGGTVADNEFIPADKDLGDCIGTLQRPGCGSDARGGWRQYLTMGVLVAGLAFVGWRISIGVRARDAVVNSTAGIGAERTGRRDPDTAPGATPDRGDDTH